MTIYVDSVFIPGTVGRVKAKWCHLFSDEYDSSDLHVFAAKVGLKRAWFQWKSHGTGQVGPPWLWHYDVTESVRVKAISAGATEVGTYGMTPYVSAKRALFDALSEEDRVAERAQWEAVAKGLEVFTQKGLF
jgi:hypothetical protein